MRADHTANGVNRLLREGAPLWIVAGVVTLAVVALLASAALRGGEGTARGWAQIRVVPGSCAVTGASARDVTDCFQVGRDTFRVRFARSLAGRVAVATRGTCCPGAINATVESDRIVLVTFPAESRYPVVFSLVVP